MKHEITSLNTKKMLAQSLKKFMQTKPFSKITVSEIVKDCDVNRKTFYYHFTDIYDLLHWMLQEEAIEVVQNFNLMLDYEDAISFVMDYIEENDHIINGVLDSISRDELKRFFYEDFIQITTLIVEDAEKQYNTRLDEDYKQFVCQFYSEAIAGMLIDWIKHRTVKERESISKYLSTTIKTSLMGIFSNNCNNPSI
ncbi:MAG: TetR/AcrR family transcriptional regulator C-terminal domain-containing protein [Ruminococcus sp.]